MDYKYNIENIENLLKEKKEILEKKIKESEMLDEEGYPTEDALYCIENWNFDNAQGWFSFIKSIWCFSDWGWQEYYEPHNWRKDTEVFRYDISTGGWSGNESIIRSMKKNDLLWHTTWFSSRRGGHYIFEVLNDEYRRKE
jgi:hypothetical protein